MPSRGHGKYNNDLDAAIHSLSLDGGADEEASYGDGGGWYGLMRDGAELAKAIEDRRGHAPEEVEGVDEEELDYLRKTGKAGVILFERSDGIVEASYYASTSALDKDWAEVEAETSPGFTVLVSGQHLDNYSDEEGALARAEKEHNERGNLVLVEVFDNASEEIVWSSDEEETQSLSLLRKGAGKETKLRKNSKLRDVSSKYGAPMGRRSEPVFGNVTLERVRIDDGGYDTGGAYWGTGAPLWRAQDEDGNEKFFRAADRAGAKAELADEGCTVVAGSGERQNEGTESKLETDGDLAELLRSAAESADVPSEHHRNLEITPELSKIAAEYEEELWKVLSQLVSQYPPAGDADANVLMEDGGAPINVFMTLAGYGVGIDDGRWDEYYDSDVIEAKVEPFIEAKMGRWANDVGSGKLVEAIDNAVYENERRLGVERDDENNVIEREENRRGRRPTHRPNGTRSYAVRLVHKISPSDKDTKPAITLPDGAFSNKNTLARALRDARVIPAGTQIESFRVEGNRVVAFPRGISWHSVILTDEGAEEGGRPTHRPNGSTAWLVLLNGEQTDVVFFSEAMDAADVKRSLIDHDGYDPRITVKKRERRKTHAPDAFAENPRVQTSRLTRKELELLKGMRDGAVHLFSGPKHTIARKLLDAGLVKRERGVSHTVAFSITDQGRRALAQV